MSNPEENVSQINIERYADVVREMIRHEDELCHQRMTWMLSLQAFLFAGVYFVWDKHWCLTLLFSILGAFSCLSIAVVLGTGIKAVHTLLEDWDGRLKQVKESGGYSYAGPPVIGLGPKKLSGYLHPFCPWYSLPTILFAGWLFILLTRILGN